VGEGDRANPVNGDYWARLGEARFGAQDYPGAREAYEQALRLGLRDMYWSAGTQLLMPGEVAYRIACCEAAAGDREAAVTALGAALDRGMRGCGQGQVRRALTGAAC
jgi:tetratricopeptide (TPR) repeat protein